ncbi:MAG: response regulator [Gammaproteobacteria bacterium]|nr:response regulator [Gammaproteobacteria bacterium]
MKAQSNPMITETCHVLLVEDDVRLSSLIQEYLQQQGIVVSIEHRGDLAGQRILDERPDLIVLDLMLPGKDGFEVCKEVRPEYSGPILMLTAKDEDIDQVVGLEIGADDYVTKPIQPRVLLARIRALLRRFGNNTNNAQLDASTELDFGGLKLNEKAREVRLHGAVVDFTSNEFELLWFIARHAGTILSRDAILEELRGIDYDGFDRSVDVRISRLRKKLGDDPARPFRIKTVRGKGYLFVAEAWD